MPNLRMTSARPPSVSATVSWPSILIEPESGRIRPRMHFSSTDLPVPEPPITTIDSPLATSRSMPCRTFFGPKDFVTPRREILEVMARHPERSRPKGGIVEGPYLVHASTEQVPPLRL